MLPDLGPVEDAIREWVAAAGVHVDQVVLNRRGRPVLVLPLPASPASGDVKGAGLSACVRDILDVLEAADGPLTTTRILDALAKRGREWSQRSVAGHLAELVRDGTLENVQDGPRRGYRVPAEG
jgi:hypothetical protein